MNITDVPYPLRLCVEMMHYCAWSNEKTAEMTVPEIYRNLGVFFTETQIEEARKILRG